MKLEMEQVIKKNRDIELEKDITGVSQQAHAADAGKPCENGEHRFFQGFCTKCNKYIGTAD